MIHQKKRVCETAGETDVQFCRIISPNDPQSGDWRLPEEEEYIKNTHYKAEYRTKA